MLYKNDNKYIRKVILLILSTVLYSALQSCSAEYPENFKTGTFTTATELNTVKFLYRNIDYQYIYSESHPGGNKLSKITWGNSGYTLEIINKTSAYDSLIKTIALKKFDADNSFTETTYTEGIGLNFTTKWVRTNESPEKKLKQVLEENGIKK